MPSPVLVAQAAAVAAPIIDDVYKKARVEAAKAVKAAIKKLKCTLYPCRCEVAKRNASYVATYNTVIAEAKDAADGGDFVTGYALASAAANLGDVQPFAGFLASRGSKPPDCTWESGPAAFATKAILANALADGYEANAEYQMQRGEGGTHRPKTGEALGAPLLIGGALILGAMLLAGGRKSGGAD